MPSFWRRGKRGIAFQLEDGFAEQHPPEGERIVAGSDAVTAQGWPRREPAEELGGGNDHGSTKCAVENRRLEFGHFSAMHWPNGGPSESSLPEGGSRLAHPFKGGMVEQ